MRGRPRKNIVPYDKHESVVFDYMSRKTGIHTLAQQYGVTSYQIREILANANVPIRTRGHPRGMKQVRNTRAYPFDDNGMELVADAALALADGKDLSDPLGDEVVTLLP